MILRIKSSKHHLKVSGLGVGQVGQMNCYDKFDPFIKLYISNTVFNIQIFSSAKIFTNVYICLNKHD